MCVCVRDEGVCECVCVSGQMYSMLAHVCRLM